MLDVCVTHDASARGVSEYGRMEGGVQEWMPSQNNHGASMPGEKMIPNRGVCMGTAKTNGTHGKKCVQYKNLHKKLNEKRFIFRKKKKVILVHIYVDNTSTIYLFIFLNQKIELREQHIHNKYFVPVCFVAHRFVSGFHRCVRRAETVRRDAEVFHKIREMRPILSSMERLGRAGGGAVNNERRRGGGRRGGGG